MELQDFDYYTFDDSKNIVKYKGYMLKSSLTDIRVKGRIAIDCDIDEAIRKDSFPLLQNIKIPQHSAIVPCTTLPYATAELIQKFTIKRKIDAGDYNVFCDLPASCLLTQYHRIYKDRKIVITDWLRETTTQIAAFMGIKDAPDNIIMKSVLCTLDKRDAWRTLLEGKCTKPCVSYKNLDMSAANPVTLDSLLMVVEAARSGNKDDFYTKVAMLNNYDWRAIPETMLLFRNCLFNGTNLGHYISNHLSSLTKPCAMVLKGILSQPSSDADLTLGREFLNAWCEVDFHNEMFVNSASLYERLNRKHISPQQFEKFYHCMTRLRTV